METLRFDWIEDEICNVYVNDRYIITMDHGPHGWDGMKAIASALNAVAYELDWAVEVKGEPGI